jgi:hypothetical protein
MAQCGKLWNSSRFDEIVIDAPGAGAPAGATSTVLTRYRARMKPALVVCMMTALVLAAACGKSDKAELGASGKAPAGSAATGSPAPADEPKAPPPPTAAETLDAWKDFRNKICTCTDKACVEAYDADHKELTSKFPPEGSPQVPEVIAQIVECTAGKK